MRTSVCFQVQGVVKRVVVVNESKDGVYVCLVLGGVDFHASYHTNGRRHFKDAGMQVGPAFAGVPINDVRGMINLGHCVVPRSVPMLQRDAPYDGDQRTESVVMLHETLLAGDYQDFALDVWLIDRGSEREFYNYIGRKEFEGYARVTELLTSLDNFPGHKVAVSLLARRHQNIL